MRLIEDQELEGSVDKHAQIFPARQQEFKLVDVGEQQSRRVSSHFFFSQAFLRGGDDNTFVLFIFLCQVFVGGTPFAARQAHDTLEIALIGCGCTYVHAKGDPRTNQHPAQAPELVDGEGIHGIHQHCYHTLWRAFITQA